MTISETLVQRWHGLPLDGFPPTVLERTALCVEDTLAVSFAAASNGVGMAGTRVARHSGPGLATLWGAGTGVRAGESAFANGMLAHAMDYDDLHAAAVMHSSAVVVPTAIALAEQQRVSGPEMLAAAAVGYQVAALLGRLAPGAFQEHGFQSTAALGTFAATAIAARVLHLTAAQVVNAYGIAGGMASGSMEFLSNGSDVKQMHPGWAAHSGIRAAELAGAGFTGPSTVFEGRFGVFRSFARTVVDPAALCNRDQWEVVDMGHKPYPACLCVHPQVQAMLELRARGAISADHIDDIAEIRCDVPHFYVPLVYEPMSAKRRVRTQYEARFSAPYCMARALLDGALTVASFAPEKLSDVRVAAIAEKVTYRKEALPEFPQSFPARVTVIKHDGSLATAYVAHNLGSPANPLSVDQVGQKFLECSTPGLGERAARMLQAAIRDLPKDGEGAFFRALRAAAIAIGDSLEPAVEANLTASPCESSL